jgi:hypothetical protein
MFPFGQPYSYHAAARSDAEQDPGSPKRSRSLSVQSSCRRSGLLRTTH